MKKHKSSFSIIMYLLAGLLVIEVAYAENVDSAKHHKGSGNAQNEKYEQSERKSGNKNNHSTRNYNQEHDDNQWHNNRQDQNITLYFNDQHRAYIHDYYQERFHMGRCPPGLSKRDNGCAPPGQTRRWKKGYPLPRDVTFYALPPSVVVQLGPPPPHHRYVRVASDILLIAIGTGLVVDAIDDLGRQ